VGRSDTIPRPAEAWGGLRTSAVRTDFVQEVDLVHDSASWQRF
jgi:hypothetical protein